jgi:hypothetical protein
MSSMRIDRDTSRTGALGWSVLSALDPLAVKMLILGDERAF